jgi:hypothetical protein
VGTFLSRLARGCSRARTRLALACVLACTARSCVGSSSAEVVHETAKDRRNLRPNIGWGFRGITPYVRDWHLTRGGRVSALTLFSSRGFEDWRMTKGTFNTSAFQVRLSTPLA